MSGDKVVERKEFEVLDRVSIFGKTQVKLECPFCHAKVWAYLWSLAGCGKKCPCGAKFTYMGGAYRVVEVKD